MDTDVNYIQNTLIFLIYNYTGNTMNNKKIVLAFSYSAGEFLDERLEELKIEYGDLPFFEEGVYVLNKQSAHPHEWWVPENTVTELNNLITNTHKT